MRTRSHLVLIQSRLGTTQVAVRPKQTKQKTKLKQSVEFTIRETGSLYYADDTIFTFVRESCLFDQEVSSNRTCKPLSSLQVCPRTPSPPNESDSEMFNKLCHTSTLAVIAWFQSFRWFLFRMVSAYFGSVRICRTGHAQIWYYRIWGSL